MIQRVITKKSVRDPSGHDDLSYWLTRPPEERVATVELLRRQYHGSTSRLQRLARVTERTRG